jgi:hypothetical protein
MIASSKGLYKNLLESKDMAPIGRRLANASWADYDLKSDLQSDLTSDLKSDLKSDSK